MRLILKKRIPWFFIPLLFIVLFLYRGDIFFSIGNIFFDKKILNQSLYNINIAQKFYLLAGRDYPHTLKWTNYQLSRTYFIQGDLNKALFYADKELELYPDNCRTYYIRGLTYGYMEELDRAIADFEEFNTNCVKNSWAGHNDLAWFYFRKGDILNMRRTIERVVPLHPSNPWVLNTHGLSLLNSKEYMLARQSFEKAGDVATKMTEADWGRAYPGNNPKIYGEGLEAMRETLAENLRITKDEESLGGSKISPTKNP